MTPTAIEEATSALVAPLLTLPADQRHALIGQLWDSLQTEAPTPLPAWKIEALHASRAQYLAHPETAVSWGAMQQGMAQKYGWDQS
jgi:hypothetical protein